MPLLPVTAGANAAPAALSRAGSARTLRPLAMLRRRVPLWMALALALHAAAAMRVYAWVVDAAPPAPQAANAYPTAAGGASSVAAVASAPAKAVLGTGAASAILPTPLQPAAAAPPKQGVRIAYPTTGEPIEVRANAAFERRPPTFHSNAEVFFSIVVAAYNQGKFLEETMQSVFNQAHDRWEAIIVNDGSTDATWDVSLNLLARNDNIHRLMAVNKRNGGLADARNVGMGYARGDWLCMLDSDDLLDSQYLLNAAKLAAHAAAPPSDPQAPKPAMVDIVPGCMRNFDAVDNDWCFPEGWSVTGVAHWNKFHASVLQRRALMETVGGYDPSIPWGLEDWNYWLHAAVHNPVVRYVPSLTFWYRHHAGTSMRKKMFASYLELTKAMVRTNHASLYEPEQLLRDHVVIAAMDDETLRRLEEKMTLYPGLPKPHLWRALRLQRLGQHAEALKDLQAAITLEGNLAKLRGRDDPYAEWQALYSAALSAEKLGAVSQALELVDRAMAGCYHDALQSLKHRLEAAGAHSRPGGLPAQAVPSYWGNAKEEANIRANTLAGKLTALAEAGAGKLARERREGAMVALLRSTSRAPCLHGSLPSPDGVNLVQNAHFRDGPRGWSPFGDSGFTVGPPPDGVPRPGAPAASTVAVLRSESDAGSAGATQSVVLGQHTAEPVLLRAWSRGSGIGGASDAAWSLYVDVSYADGTHEWGFNLPFDTKDGEWQLRTAYLDRRKAIKSLEVYCMLRGKSGTAWFADIVVAHAARSACACPEGQAFLPSSAAPCAACPHGRVCLLGEPLAAAGS